jgi:hypothetical protein
MSKWSGFIQAIDEHFKLIRLMVSLPDKWFRMLVQISNELCCRFSGGNSTVADKLVEAKRQFRMERMIWILSVIMRRLKWRYRFS